MKRNSLLLLLGVLTLVLVGCRSNTGNSGRMQLFPIMSSEAAWIRNGESIEFEGMTWYPTDIIENLLDSEVFMTGEYRGAQFFIEKADVKPYNGLYTKFDVNKFRLFEQKVEK